MPVLNLLKKTLKKNKSRLLTVAGFTVLSVSEYTFTYVQNSAKLARETSEEVRINTVRLSSLEDNLNRNNLVLKDIVKRASFNAYIAHTDDRFKTLQRSNTELTQSMGFLQGKVSGLEKIIYALNLYEIQKTK